MKLPRSLSFYLGGLASLVVVSSGVFFLAFHSAPAAAIEIMNLNSQRSSSSGSSGCGGAKSTFSENDVQQIALQVYGSSEKAACYMKLFTKETSVNASCNQQNVPNPPGIGLCTLEGDPTKREARGGDCAVSNDELNGDTKEGIENQMKCCASIMKKNGNAYFQPVKEGQVENCESGSGSTIGI